MIDTIPETIGQLLGELFAALSRGEEFRFTIRCPELTIACVRGAEQQTPSATHSTPAKPARRPSA